MLIRLMLISLITSSAGLAADPRVSGETSVARQNDSFSAFTESINKRGLALPESVRQAEESRRARRMYRESAVKTLNIDSSERKMGPTTSSGGGNICFTPQGPELLDLVKDQTRIDRQRLSGLEIPNTQERFSFFDPFVGKLKDRIQQIISQNASPPFNAALQAGLRNNWFIAVPVEFTSPVEAHFQNPQICSSNNVRAAIGLVGGLKFVSTPIWNSLDLDTQAFLVIHEGWRFAQIVLNLPISNEELQNFTYDFLSGNSKEKNPGLRSLYIRAKNDLLHLANSFNPGTEIRKSCFDLIEEYDNSIDEIDRVNLKMAAGLVSVSVADVFMQMLQDKLKKGSELPSQLRIELEKLLDTFPHN